jgi:DNA-binding transcriptional MerR regulator
MRQESAANTPDVSVTRRRGITAKRAIPDAPRGLRNPAFNYKGTLMLPAMPPGSLTPRVTRGNAGQEDVMDATTMLSIKEFADFTGLHESTLRYYDKIGLLSPELRGANRYRYYSPLQAIMIDFIKVLIKVGVPLATIKEMNKTRTPQGVLDLLMRQESKLDAQLHELQTAYAIIHTYRNTIQAGINAQIHTIDVRTLDERRLTLGPETDFNGSESFYGPFMHFCTSAPEYKINLHYPIGGYYANMHTFLDTPPQPTRFFSLDPRGYNTRPAGQYMVAYNKGHYGVFGDLPQRMLAHAQTNALSFHGPLYIVYLLDEISLTDHNRFVSQIMVGVSPAR